MPIVYALNCPNCGAGLQVPQGSDRFACAFCGTALALSNFGGAVTLSAVVGAIEGVENAAARAASELAITRLSQELKLLKQDRAAMVTKNTNALREAAELVTEAQQELATDIAVGRLIAQELSFLRVVVVIAIVAGLMSTFLAMPLLEGSGSGGGGTLSANQIVCSSFVGLVVVGLFLRHKHLQGRQRRNLAEIAALESRAARDSDDQRERHEWARRDADNAIQELDERIAKCERELARHKEAVDR